MSKTKFDIADLFELRGAVIYNPDDYKATARVTIDSRAVKKGAIFVAIKGKRFDGHSFVRDAVKNGAGAVVISKRKLGEFDDVDIPIVAVPNTIKAFGELAAIKREKLNYKIVGITGSNGKTTTKEFAATLLSEKFKTGKTEANNNNNIGVPLTILNAKTTDEALVVELGTNHFGEIKYAAEIARPDVAMITNIGLAHSKYLKDKKGVLKEKSALFEVTAKRDGAILLNVDDAMLKKLRKKYANVTTFGFSDDAEINGEFLGYAKDGLPKLRVTYGKRKLEVKIPLYGKANISNALNAVAIALLFGLSNSEIRRGVKKFAQTPGRFEVIKLRKATIINDAYNASPESMRAAIESLAEMPAKKRIAILADMLELGENAPELHAKLASSVKKAKFDALFLVGKNMARLAEARGVSATHFKNAAALLKKLDDYDFTDATILIKGSRGMKLERIVKYFTEKYD